MKIASECKTFDVVYLTTTKNCPLIVAIDNDSNRKKKNIEQYLLCLIDCWQVHLEN